MVAKAVAVVMCAGDIDSVTESLNCREPGGGGGFRWRGGTT